MYFFAAIVILILLGGLFGMHLLAKVALKGSYASIPMFALHAHGHAQMVGWIFLFIMGLFYAKNSFKSTKVFSCMVTGIILHTLGLGVANIYIACAGSIFEIIGASLFIRGVFQKSNEGIFFKIGALCFTASILYASIHTFNTLSASTSEVVTRIVAMFHTPLRNLQMHGGMLLMLLGLLLPVEKQRKSCLAWIVIGLTSEISLFLLFRLTKLPLFASSMLLARLFLAYGVFLAIKQYQARNSLQKGALFWLYASVALLLAEPLYQFLSHIRFSHAYYGAIRHAFTVGFVTQMLISFTLKDERAWFTRAINIGCSLRVALQILTDFHPMFWAFAGISGVIELSAFSWWGLTLLHKRAVTITLPTTTDELKPLIG